MSTTCVISVTQNLPVAPLRADVANSVNFLTGNLLARLYINLVPLSIDTSDDIKALLNTPSAILTMAASNTISSTPLSSPIESNVSTLGSHVKRGIQVRTAAGIVFGIGVYYNALPLRNHNAFRYLTCNVSLLDHTGRNLSVQASNSDCRPSHSTWFECVLASCVHHRTCYQRLIICFIFRMDKATSALFWAAAASST